jgi:hypothetical protein
MGKITSTNGFVFFILLLFLQIFALISLYGWMVVNLNLKNNMHLWQREMFFHTSENILLRLKDNLPFLLSHCPITILSPHYLSLQPISWWQSHACSAKLNEISYYYVVEPLGKDPCGIINNDTNSVFIADYYRITLFALSDKTQIAKLILQSTFVKPEKSTLPCMDKLHFVTKGLQMCREI